MRRQISISGWPSSHLIRPYSTKPRLPHAAKPHSKPPPPKKSKPNSTSDSKSPTKQTQTPTIPPATTPPKLPYVAKPHNIHTLADGRNLGYSLYGPSLTYRQIPTLLVFHGFPGSRLDAYGLLPPSLKSSLRIIGVDRPGVGLSTFQRDRKVLDFPGDVLGLMNGLGIERFSVLGGSAGAAYALACAKALDRKRLRGVGIVSGFAPRECGLEVLSAREKNLLRNPSLMRLVMYWRVGRHISSSSSSSNIWEKMAREMGYEGNNVRGVIESLKEPFRQGVGGYVHDGALMVGDWGFKMEDVKGGVKLWYGEDDANTPVQMGRWMRERLEGGYLKVYKDLGHFGVMERWGGEILRELTEH